MVTRDVTDKAVAIRILSSLDCVDFWHRYRAKKRDEAGGSLSSGSLESRIQGYDYRLKSEDSTRAMPTP